MKLYCRLHLIRRLKEFSPSLVVSLPLGLPPHLPLILHTKRKSKRKPLSLRWQNESDKHGRQQTSVAARRPQAPTAAFWKVSSGASNGTTAATIHTALGPSAKRRATGDSRCYMDGKATLLHTVAREENAASIPTANWTHAAVPVILRSPEICLEGNQGKRDGTCTSLTMISCKNEVTRPFRCSFVFETVLWRAGTKVASKVYFFACICSAVMGLGAHC